MIKKPQHLIKNNSNSFAIDLTTPDPAIKYFNENTLEKNYSVMKEMKCYFCAVLFTNIDYITCLTCSKTFHKNCIENYIFSLNNNDKKVNIEEDLVECIFCRNKYILYFK